MFYLINLFIINQRETEKNDELFIIFFSCFILFISNLFHDYIKPKLAQTVSLHLHIYHIRLIIVCL